MRFQVYVAAATVIATALCHCLAHGQDAAGPVHRVEVVGNQTLMLESTNSVTVDPQGRIYWVSQGVPNTRQQLEHLRKSTIAKLKSTSDQEQRSDILDHMKSILDKFFDREMDSRSQAISSIEERSKKLLAELQKRKQSKQQIIDLQLKILEFDAKGLGYFNEPAANDASGDATTATPKEFPLGAGNHNPARITVDKLDGKRVRVSTEFGGGDYSAFYLIDTDAYDGWTPQRLKRTMEGWKRSLKNAAGAEELQKAKAKVLEGMNSYFDADIQHRKQAIDKITKRADELRKQLDARQKAKDEIISLQMKVIENEAAGLGFYPAEKQIDESGQASRQWAPLTTRQYFNHQETPKAAVRLIEEIRQKTPAGKTKTDVQRWIDATYPQLESAWVASNGLKLLPNWQSVAQSEFNEDQVDSALRLDMPVERDIYQSVYFLFDEDDQLIGHFTNVYRQSVKWGVKNVPSGRHSTVRLPDPAN